MHARSFDVIKVFMCIKIIQHSLALMRNIFVSNMPWSQRSLDPSSVPGCLFQAFLHGHGCQSATLRLASLSSTLVCWLSLSWVGKGLLASSLKTFVEVWLKSKWRGLHQQGFPSQLLGHHKFLLLSLCNLLKGSGAVTPQIWLIMNSARSKTHFNHKATIVGWNAIPRVKATSIFLFQWKTLTSKNKSNVKQADYNVVDWFLIQGLTCTPDLSQINSNFHRSCTAACFPSAAASAGSHFSCLWVPAAEVPVKNTKLFFLV